MEKKALVILFYMFCEFQLGSERFDKPCSGKVYSKGKEEILSDQSIQSFGCSCGAYRIWNTIRDNGFYSSYQAKRDVQKYL